MCGLEYCNFFSISADLGCNKARQTFLMNWRAHLISSTQVSFSCRTYISSTRVLSMVFRLASRSSVVRFLTISSTYRYPEKKCTIIFQFTTQCCGRDVYPGSRIQKQQQKRRVEFFLSTLFGSHK